MKGRSDNQEGGTSDLFKCANIILNSCLDIPSKIESTNLKFKYERHLIHNFKLKHLFHVVILPKLEKMYAELFRKNKCVCGTLHNTRMLSFAFKPEKIHTCTYAKFSSEKVVSKKV